ncbi:hypothetical protein WEH80_37175 [Actinomycetes bacterium KLBMP 9759]
MSANHYLDSPNNEAGHIGKSSNNFFIGKAPKGINSFDEWLASMEGHRIFGEHGLEYISQEMAEIAMDRRSRLDRNPNQSRGEFVDRGVLFVRHDFSEDHRWN